MSETPAPSPAPSPSPAASAAWSLLYVVVVTAGILGIHTLMMPYGSGGTMFLGWLLTVGVLVISSGAVARRISASGVLFFAVIAYAVLSLIYSAMGGMLPRILGIRETPAIAVAEADRPEHARAHVFHFTDGRVALNYEGTEVLSRKRGRITYYVAPVVPEGWKATDPVPAWVAAESWRTEGVSTGWKSPWRGGYRIRPEIAFDRLVRETAGRHRLVTAPNAPILVWSQDPRADLDSRVKAELWSVVVVDLVVLASLILLPLLPKRRAAA